MSKVIARWTVAWVLCGLGAAASARDDAPWDGGYLGFNVGDASSSACNSWNLDGGTMGAANASQFDSRTCSKTSALVGGAHVGENYQYKRIVWGIGADLDYWAAKTRHTQLVYAGSSPPPGSYSFSDKEGPKAFAVIGPRVGYAGDTWLPYVRLGGVLAPNSRSELFYTPTGAKVAAASFAGGKDFSTTGWAAGGGLELGLNGAWSISAEYLHVSLGKGSDSTGSCNGTATACAPFAGVVLNTSHEGFTANVFRLGFTYWFNYW